MLPTIAEIVLVHEGLTGLDEIFEAMLALILKLEIAGVVDVGHPVVRPVDRELVQVRVGPSHRNLDREVKVLERERARNLDRAPDRRLDLPQPDI